MDHTTALNLILANECSNPSAFPDPQGREVKEFNLTGHCTNYTVHAVLVSTLNTIQYDILSVEVNN